jgi:hypothetical protein
MSQDQTKKEALFNEVKGSLFEYLVAKRLALLAQDELSFIKSIDPNYLNVLSQQDRMVRQFYPEMLPFLEQVSRTTVERLIAGLGKVPLAPRLTGKFVNSQLRAEFHEADLLVEVDQRPVPISLKLNKKNAFVNTKSGGIKSFFSEYFPFLPAPVQADFNQLVDMEFNRMAVELHELHELEYSGSFQPWVGQGLSELPGELDPPGRAVLKRYYSRLAAKLHEILERAQAEWPREFRQSLPTLMGFGTKQMLQVICYHDFKSGGPCEVELHTFQQLSEVLEAVRLKSFEQKASVEVELGNWMLQIRIKPMNKFTTTAIKMNCSIKTF